MKNELFIIRKLKSFKEIVKLKTLNRDLRRFGLRISFYERLESLSEYFNIFKLNRFSLEKLILVKNNSRKIHLKQLINQLTQLNSKETNTILKKNPYLIDLIANKCSLSLIEKLYKFHLLYGKIINAYFIKKAYKIKLIKNQNDSFYLNQKALQAGLEDGRFKWVLKILKEKEIKKNLFYEEIISFAYLCIGKVDECERVREKITNDDDRLLQDLILNKSVAVVGPAPINSLDKKEINDFDIIIKPNLLDLNSEIYNQDKLITYYNLECSESEEKEKSINKIIDKLKLVSFKHKKAREKYNLNILQMKKLRIMRLPVPLMLNFYGPNMMQNIIYDVTWNISKIKRIKLFGTTFFTGRNLYEKSYYSNLLSKERINRDIRIHDPFSNFSFIHHLYKKNLIEADRQTSSILDYDYEAYANQLNKFT